MDEEQVVSTEVAEEPKETPAPEPEETAEQAEEAAEPPKPKKTAQERIDEITRKRRDAERERDYWRNAALKTEPPKEAPVEKPQGPARPRLDQFETTEEYEDALFAWRDSIKETETAQRRRAEEQETAVRTFQQRSIKLRAEHDDFDEVIERPVFSDAMRDALLVNENGPQLAYYLGSNPAEADRIRVLPVVQQIYELGRLETKMALAKETKKAPSAPEPIKPVGMGGGSQDKDPSKMSDDEWFAWNKEKQKKEIEDRLKARGRI